MRSALSAAFLFLTTSGACSAGPKFDERVIDWALEPFAKRLLTIKGVSVDGVSKDRSALVRIAVSAEIRQIVASGDSPDIESDEELGRALGHSWVAFRLKRDDYKAPITLADISDDLRRQVRIRVETEPTGAAVVVNGVDCDLPHEKWTRG